MNPSANGGALDTWTPNPAHAGKPRTPKTARRRAAWLIAAWMAFWLVTVIQPYCNAFASGATAVATADNQPESDGHPHEVPHCPELTALGLQLLTDTLAASSAPATVFIAHSSSAAVILPFHDAVDQHSSYSTPPPRLAVYLSTSRLLI